MAEGVTSYENIKEEELQERQTRHRQELGRPDKQKEQKLDKLDKYRRRQLQKQGKCKLVSPHTNKME